MKIFPLKPMSNYDRFQNLMNILEHNRNVQTCCAENASKYGIALKVEPAKRSLWDGIIDRVKPAASEFVAKIKDYHGKKSSGV